MTAPVRPLPLSTAALLVWLVGAVVAALGVGTVAQLHGRFSAGVGVMLLVYAAVLAWVGWSAWTLRFYARGMLVGTGLLHLFLAVSSMAAGNVAIWTAVSVVSVVTVVAAMLPSTSAALDRARRPSADDWYPES
jgi:hypothetical protein